MPSTDVIPREGSFALASFGRFRKVQETAFAVAAGRKSVALKQILEAVLELPSSRMHWSIVCEAAFGVRETYLFATRVVSFVALRAAGPGDRLARVGRHRGDPLGGGLPSKV